MTAARSLAWARRWGWTVRAYVSAFGVSVVLLVAVVIGERAGWPGVTLTAAGLLFGTWVLLVVAVALVWFARLVRAGKTFLRARVEKLGAQSGAGGER